MDVIQNKKYFFLTKSVFEVAAKNSSNSSSKLLLKCVMLKLLHRKKIDDHIIYFPQDEVDNIKTELGESFQAMMEVGENMFSAQHNPAIRGNINHRVLAYATNKDGDIPETDVVKIIYADAPTKSFFDKSVSEHDYPVEVCSVEEAIKDIEEILQDFANGKCYIELKASSLSQ